MKAKMTAITLALCLCAALLSGCGGSSSTAVSTTTDFPAATTIPSNTSDVENTASIKNEVLGIVSENAAYLSEDDVLGLCKESGLSFDAFSRYEICPDVTYTTQDAAEYLIAEGCSTIIFNEKGSSEIAKIISDQYPEIKFIVTESAKIKVPILVASYSFANCKRFHNGLAWITYIDGDNNKQLAAINEDFKIIYKSPWSLDAYAYADDFMEDGYAYYGFYDDEVGWEYVIIDKDGNELYRTRNTDDTKYEICGHGDGVFILRKKISNLTNNAIYISTISADGEILFGDQEIEKDFATDFMYYGEGIFRSYDGRYNYSGGFLNANTGAVFKEYSYSDKFLTSFDDGKAYFQAAGFDGPIGDKTTVVTPDVFASEDSYRAWHDSLSEDDVHERFIPVLSYQDPIKVTGIGYGSGGYYPVQLKGADGYAYFTIVDKDGVQQYDPIKYPEFKYIMFTGDTTIQEKLDARFVNGIFTYYEDEKWCVVFPDGAKKQFSISGERPTGRDFNGFDGTYLYLCNSFNSDSSQSVINVLNGEVHYEVYQYDELGKQPVNEEKNKVTESKIYTIPSSFSIEGKWKNIGSYSFGQVDNGGVVSFDGTYCNLYSPRDTYAFYKDGDSYYLDTTSILGEPTSFTVKIVDKNNIDVYYGSDYLELTRVG